jgi:hypothetical protein
MRLATPVFCIAVLLLSVGSNGLRERGDGHVEGVVVDVQGARIADATLTFTSGKGEQTALTGVDGAYSIDLRPGTYRLSISSRGFCTFPRAAFVLHKAAAIRFNFQMWICPTDMKLIRYQELDEVSNSDLRPLILFGKSERQDNLERFVGAEMFNDGTGHTRRYPAILTFNRLTVQCDEIVYNPSQRLLIVRGNVSWESGEKSGKADRARIYFGGLDPLPLPSTPD